MKCPGQDSRYWKPESIFEEKCPNCGKSVEFFKDDTSRKCNHCGHRFVNPKMDFGCAAYCQFAEQCVGALPEEALAQRDDMFKDRVAIEMKRYFKTDFKRIGHASRVARHAERIGRNEGGNLAVILAASYLHDIGIVESEKKYNSSAAQYQEKEGPPVAKSILEKLGANKDLVNEVCDIIGHHHHPRSEETINFMCLYDADLIVNLEETHKKVTILPEKLEHILQTAFLTQTGKKIGKEVLCH